MQRREVLRLAAGVFVPNCPGLASRPQPKFQIGDRVFWEYEEGQRCYGMVVGSVFHEEEWLTMVIWDDHNPEFSRDWQPWQEDDLVAA